jgi:outer membrane protein OmpA-like peptidoglycan-associated protein
VAQLPDEDEENCKDPKALSRLTGCKITQCRTADFDSVDVQVGGKPGEDPTKKSLEGELEIVEYACAAKLSQLQVVRNAETALKASGYKIVFQGTESPRERQLTANAGNQWVAITTTQANEFPLYTVTVAKVKAMTQEMEASADAWISKINETGRVAVYGIHFDTGKATISPDSEPVLNEVAALLAKQPDWKLTVEGHTDNVGAKAANQTLSKQRADSVVAWLVAHGTDKSRLSAQGLGDSKPVADNTTDEGKAKNRRVELVKQ